MAEQRYIFLYDEFIDGTKPKMNFHYNQQGKNLWSRFHWEYITPRGSNPGYSYYPMTIDRHMSVDKSIQTFYVVELIWANLSIMFDHIKQESLDYIIKNNIPMIFYLPTEGFNFESKDWNTLLEKKFAQHNLTNVPKYLVTGNIKIEKSKIFNKCFYANWCEYGLYRTSKIEGIENFQSSSNDKPFDFLNYNANPRPARVAMASEIIRNELNKTALFSWIGGDTHYQVENTLNKAMTYLDIVGQLYLKKHGFQKHLLDVDVLEKRKLVNVINKDHYQKTYFSLVNETETANDCLFITEKTYKAILGSHPFIIFGNPHTLKYLKRLGYKTFPNIFDESYDNETSEKVRIQMIIQELQKFKNLDRSQKTKLIRENKHIVKHNYKNLLNRWSTSFLNEIDKILKDITIDILVDKK